MYQFDYNWSCSWDSNGESYSTTYILQEMGFQKHTEYNQETGRMQVWYTEIPKKVVDTVYVYPNGTICTHSGKQLHEYGLIV